MPIFWREGLKPGITVVVFSDPYSTKDSEATLSQIFARRDTRSPLHLLVDARYSSAPNQSFVASTISFWQHHINHIRDARIAVVVANDAQYGMARLAATSAELKDLPVAIEPFRDWADAERWLDGR